MSDDTRASTGGSLATQLAERGLTLETAPDKIVVDIVKELTKASVDYKERFYLPRWLRSLYFVMGHQHLYWATGRKRWFPLLVEQDARKVVNLVKGRWLTDAARLVKSTPSFDVVASRPTADSREQARVALRILRAIHERTDFGTIMMLAAQERALFGGVFAIGEWDVEKNPVAPKPAYATDPITGQPLIIDGQPQVMVDGRGAPIMEAMEPQGELSIRLVSYLDAIVPPSAQGIKASEWEYMGERRAVPVSEIRAKWGVSVEKDPSATDLSARIGHDLGQFFSRGSDQFSADGADESAYVIDFHQPALPLPGWERGGRVLVAGDHLVDKGPGLLPDGRVPYHHLPFIPIPTQPFGDSFVPDYIGPQMEFNEAKSDVSRARRRLRHPHIFYEEGSISPEVMTSGGRSLEIRRGHQMPTVPNLPGINAAVVAELEASRSDIDAAGSQHAFSRGQMVGRSPQPVGTVELMQQADASDLSFAIRIGASAMADLGTDLLTLARQHYTSDQTAMLVGEGEDPEVFTFSGGDLDTGLQVIVQPGSELPTQKEALRSQLTELIKSGVLAQQMQDPAFMAKILEMFEMPSPDQTGSLGTLDRKLQERENRRILFDPNYNPQEPAPVNPNDDHQMHVDTIDRRSKASDWQTIPPERRQALMAHREAHMEAIKQAQMEQMVAELVAQEQARQQIGAQGQEQEGSPAREGPL